MAVSICTRSVFALAFAFSWLLCPRAHAGPPFRTDDPVPVAFGHYELYTAAIGTHVKGDTSGGLPSVELTYGLIPNGQLQIGGELAFDSSGGGTHFGYGDTQLSFKYRFIQEQAKRVLTASGGL